MPDILDQNGLQTLTFNELRDQLVEGLKGIYGTDINVDQNSPDGQMVNIFTQAGIDVRDLITMVNAGFDPDLATGVTLDERVATNNIQRQGGTFTIVPITITASTTVDLAGLDGAFYSLDGTGYTVQDNAGNQFILVDSTTVTSGDTVLNFRAKKIGQVETTVNTITNQVTIVLGVTAVNNPSGALQVGQDEETDAELRVRRQRSVALSSSGYLNGLLGTVLGIDGVTDAKLYENVTNAVDADGIPAHGIWLIAEGGANTDIGQAIYKKKSFGANMKGVVSVAIPTPSGATFTALFDRPTASNLHVRFDLKTTVTGTAFDQAAIKATLVDLLDYSIGQYAETSSVTAKAREAIDVNGGGGVPINVEISSDGMAWVDFLSTPTLASQWVADTTRITITVIP